MRFALFFGFLVLGPLWASEPTRLSDHVVLISIDGFRPDWYRESQWPAPTLQHMAANGVSVDEVHNIFPSVTYPSHTSIITGAKPARHGIFYNGPFRKHAWTREWYWFAKDIKSRTLWDAAKDAGLTSANLLWPVSVGAPVNWNVPETWPIDGTDYFDHLRKHVKPASLYQELEEKATGKLTSSTFDNDWTARETRNALIASYLLETYKPNFMTVHFILTDFSQHDHGRDHLKVRQAVANADQAVTLIWEAAQRAGIADRTSFLITGDHGFVNVHSSLAPNVWLVKAGLRTGKRQGDNWKATFHTTGASGFLMLRDPNDRETLAQVKQIIADLPASRRSLFRVLDKEELAAIGGPSDAELALTPVKGVNIIGNVTASDLVVARKKGDHGYLPDFHQIYTGFIGFGAGFRPGLATASMQQTDIAAVAAYLLKMTLEPPDGSLPIGFFE